MYMHFIKFLYIRMALVVCWYPPWDTKLRLRYIVNTVFADAHVTQRPMDSVETPWWIVLSHR